MSINDLHPLQSHTLFSLWLHLPQVRDYYQSNIIKCTFWRLPSPNLVFDDRSAGCQFAPPRAHPKAQWQHPAEARYSDQAAPGRPASLNKCPGAIGMRISLWTGVLAPNYHWVGWTPSFLIYSNTHCHWMVIYGNLWWMVELSSGSRVPKDSSSNNQPKDQTGKASYLHFSASESWRKKTNNLNIFVLFQNNIYIDLHSSQNKVIGKTDIPFPHGWTWKHLGTEGKKLSRTGQWVLCVTHQCKWDPRNLIPFEKNIIWENDTLTNMTNLLEFSLETIVIGRFRTGDWNCSPSSFPLSIVHNANSASPAINKGLVMTIKTF